MEQPTFSLVAGENGYVLVNGNPEQKGNLLVSYDEINERISIRRNASVHGYLFTLMANVPFSRIKQSDGTYYSSFTALRQFITRELYLGKEPYNGSFVAVQGQQSYQSDTLRGATLLYLMQENNMTGATLDTLTGTLSWTAATSEGQTFYYQYKK